MAVSTDNFGRIIGISHHDGMLRAISTVDGHGIELKCTDSSGRVFEIHLREVRLFVANGFREGNIIDTIYFWPSTRVPNEAIKAMSYKSSVKLDDLTLLLKHKENAGVFMLECSYGAEIFALTGSIDIVL